MLYYTETLYYVEYFYTLYNSNTISNFFKYDDYYVVGDRGFHSDGFPWFLFSPSIVQLSFVGGIGGVSRMWG